MKRIMNATLTVALVLALGVLFTDEASAQSKATGKGHRGALFVDQDGDGICDNFGTKAGQNQKLGNRFGMKGKGYGPGDGTGNKGVGPKDGTGYGPGTGVCDGTGPKGYRGRRK
jgi:hypothetical protein